MSRILIESLLYAVILTTLLIVVEINNKKDCVQRKLKKDKVNS